MQKVLQVVMVVINWELVGKGKRRMGMEGLLFLKAISIIQPEVGSFDRRYPIWYAFAPAGKIHMRRIDDNSPCQLLYAPDVISVFSYKMLSLTSRIG